MPADLANARSFLFVPGDRPDRFAKAASSGADVVVLDLEDAVTEEKKATAREHVRVWLAEGNAAVVRVNAPGTPHHEEDVLAARDASGIIVPKAEDGSVLPQGIAVIPLLETARGIAQALDVCTAPSVVRPAFGSVDLAAQLEVDHRSHEALRHARSTVVLAAAAAGRPGPIDGVTTALDDEPALRTDIDHAVTLGFTAKLCVHPRQVRVVNEAFSPTDAELEWASGVLEAAADGGVAVYKGQMIDRPVVLRAEAILARPRGR